MYLKEENISKKKMAHITKEIQPHICVNIIALNIHLHILVLALY